LRPVARVGAASYHGRMAAWRAVRRGYKGPSVGFLVALALGAAQFGGWQSDAVALALLITAAVLAAGSVMRLVWIVAIASVEASGDRKSAADDADLPARDDRRDLAEDLDVFASRLDDWLDARAAAAPTLIEQNTSALMPKANPLTEALRIAGQDPERIEAHRLAKKHFDRNTMVEYFLGWRAEAVSLFDQAAEMGVVSPKVRERVQKPDLAQLRALPKDLRKLSERLRVQAADRVLARSTIGHQPRPMRPA
jgi:hypothetical protein